MTEDELDRHLVDSFEVRGALDSDRFVSEVMRRVERQRRRRSVVLWAAAGLSGAAALTTMATATPGTWAGLDAGDAASAVVLVGCCALVVLTADSWPPLPTAVVTPATKRRQ